MLPALTMPRKLALAGVAAAFAITASAPPALAWGKNEQNFLAGALTTAVIGGIILSNSQPRPPQKTYVVRPAPVYREAPTYYTTDREYYPARTYHPAGIYNSPTAHAFNTFTLNQRRRIQSTLANYGYYHGAIDGAFGPATFNAVKAYARNTHQLGKLTNARRAHSLFYGLLA